MGEEKDTMATDVGKDEKPAELTKFGKFCQRHGINSNLIMLKISLFVMYGGRKFLIKIYFVLFEAILFLYFEFIKWQKYVL